MKYCIFIILFLLRVTFLLASDNKDIMLSNIKYSDIGSPHYLKIATKSIVDSIRMINVDYEEYYNEDYLRFLKFEPHYQDYSLFCLIWPYMKDPVSTSFIVSKGNQIQIYKTLESYLNTILSIEPRPSSDTLVSMLLCWFKEGQINSSVLSIQSESVPFCWVKNNDNTVSCRTFEWITNSDYYDIFSSTGKVNYPIKHHKVSKHILPKAKINHNEIFVKKWQQFAYGHNCKSLFYELFHNDACQIGVIESKYKKGYAYALVFMDDDVCCFELGDIFNYYFDNNGQMNTLKNDCCDYNYLIEKILFSSHIEDKYKIELIDTIHKIRTSIRW